MDTIYILASEPEEIVKYILDEHPDIKDGLTKHYDDSPEYEKQFEELCERFDEHGDVWICEEGCEDRGEIPVFYITDYDPEYVIQEQLDALGIEPVEDRRFRY